MAYDDDDDDGPGFLTTAIVLTAVAGGGFLLWRSLSGQAQAATVLPDGSSAPVGGNVPSGFVNLIQSVLSPGASSGLPRGISNNNPGNIKRSAANDWQGQTGQDANGFAIFSDPVYGLRAMFMVLQAYSNEGALFPNSTAPFSISNIVTRWTSGDSAADQAGWVSTVESVSGIPRGQQIDPTSQSQMQALVNGIVAAENGLAYAGYYAATEPQAWSMAA